MDNPSSRLSLIIAAVAALGAVAAAAGTIYQQTRPQEIIVLSYQTREEKEIVAKVKEAREEIERLAHHKQTLEVEISKLEEHQRRIAAKARALVSSRVPSDPWYVTAVKTVDIYILLTSSGVVSAYAFILDMLLLPFGYWFPLIQGLWAFSWNTATIQWFWIPSRRPGIVAGGLLLFSFLAILGAVVENWREQRRFDEKAA